MAASASQARALRSTIIQEDDIKKEAAFFCGLLVIQQLANGTNRSLAGLRGRSGQ
jgi:hypothetical protein